MSTTTPQHHKYPRFSLHDSLKAMVEAASNSAEPPHPSMISSGLTIKITSNCNKGELNGIIPIQFSLPHVTAFISICFSHVVTIHISSRAMTPKTQENPTSLTLPSPPVSYRGSLSDDIPNSSYTSPLDQYEFSDDPADAKLKFVTCDTAPPRISFSFPVPQFSFAKGLVSPNSNTKLKCSDVYIGFHGQNPNLVHFSKWLKLELKLQGIACFVADRAKYSDSQSHEIVNRDVCSVTFRVVVVTNSSFLNHLSLEEIRFFAQKKSTSRRPRFELYVMLD
ncbi:hypothetical protein CJ030_MR3G009532 [Morella rubra]|uniref:TIR domain-containing protein n=1 Tax=Morella rubra TaxID=262757 RepID=A0A6A1WAQ0_9ROSI|nr:hypothetical protein CJ030_MR3G009532 [Morella rubra]